MDSQVLSKLNSFTKKRLYEIAGILLIALNLFLIASIFTYSPSDPNFIYTPENTEIKNIGGFYGSVIADFFLQAIGLISLLLIITLLCWSYKLLKKQSINNLLLKAFFIIIYIISGTVFTNILFNNSYLLIDNGNGGFVGNIVKENIYNFFPLIEYKYTSYLLILLTIIFFLLSLDLTINEINKILTSPIKLIKKILILFKKNNTSIDKNINLEEEPKDSADSSTKINQPILPFSIKKKESKSPSDNFKLPPRKYWHEK